MAKTTTRHATVKPIKILGHRGARGEMPENSLVGFAHLQQLATANQHIVGVEFDVQLLADGNLAVFHDDNLNRCCNQQGWLSQLNRQELSQQQQSRLAQHFTTTKNQTIGISLLAEVLPLLYSYQQIEIEVKTHQRTHYQHLVTTLTQQLEQLPYPLPITLTSFDIALLDKLKHLPFKRGLLVEQNCIINVLIETAQRLQVSQLGLWYGLINQHVVKQAHRAGLTLTAWTVNDRQIAKRLVADGIDYVITDYPSGLV